MSDLTCANCGRETTYADAAIADRRSTCDDDPRGEHDWVDVDAEEARAEIAAEAELDRRRERHFDRRGHF